LARSRAATDVNRRAHGPRADLQARQSLLADAVRPGSPFRPPASRELEKYGLKSWIEAAARRLNRFKLAIALANKIARMAWGVLHGGRNFEVRPMKPAPQAA
jgi:hypothetical protein